ncbi:MAG: hypothetical protein CMJ77_07595 [Planctomycetaceae bacterium]|nr:hypothetical protein [Planctomycetaceae bacterium]
MNLCDRCNYRRAIISGTGGRFVLCLLRQKDKRFLKYARRPTLNCSDFQEEGHEECGDEA